MVGGFFSDSLNSLAIGSHIDVSKECPPPLHFPKIYHGVFRCL